MRTGDHSELSSSLTRYRFIGSTTEANRIVLSVADRQQAVQRLARLRGHAGHSVSFYERCSIKHRLLLLLVTRISLAAIQQPLSPYKFSWPSNPDYASARISRLSCVARPRESVMQENQFEPATKCPVCGNTKLQVLPRQGLCSESGVGPVNGILSYRCENGHVFMTPPAQR